MLHAERRGLYAARLPLQLVRQVGERQRQRRSSQGPRRILRHLPQGRPPQPRQGHHAQPALRRRRRRHPARLRGDHLQAAPPQELQQVSLIRLPLSV